MLDLVFSTEDLATELQLAAADVAIEQQLSIPTVGVQAESIAALTDQLAAQDFPDHLPNSLGIGLQDDEQIAVLSEVRDKVAEVWKSFTEWRDSTFNTAKDKLGTLAQKMIEMAAWLGVSVEHLVGRLQRRVTAALVGNAVMSTLSIGAGKDQILFTPSDLTVTTTVKSSPSLVSLDLTGVLKLLSGLLSLEIDVVVKYGVK